MFHKKKLLFGISVYVWGGIKSRVAPTATRNELLINMKS